MFVAVRGNQTKIWDMSGSEWRVLQNWMRKNCHVNHEMLGYNEYLLAGFHHEILFFFPNSNIKHLRTGNSHGITAFEHVWTLEKNHKGPVVSLAKARFCKRFSRGALGSPWPFFDSENELRTDDFKWNLWKIERSSELSRHFKVTLW